MFSEFMQEVMDYYNKKDFGNKITGYSNNSMVIAWNFDNDFDGIYASVETEILQEYMTDENGYLDERDYIPQEIVYYLAELSQDY